MEAIQILVIVFAVFAQSRLILRLKDKLITYQELIFWSIIWVLLIVLALLPGTITLLSKPLGISRGIDFLVYVGIIVLFYLIFRLYVKIETVNQEVTKLVREMAKRK